MISVTLVAGVALAGPESCPLVPRPKAYRDLGRTIPLGDARTTAIVIGQKASEPERYAAERLAGLLERRFGFRPAISVEGDQPAGARQAILLGCRESHGWLDRLCHQRQIDLSAASPGPDGFVIEFLETAGQQLIVVGGSDARGVIYGADVLFDLTCRQPGGDVVRAASVRDWPSIAWRGRPHSVLRHHLVPGAMDAYVRARINFTDVRDDPGAKATIVMPERKASMGFPPGVPIDAASVKRVIGEDHRRGMFVYGTVSCSVPRARLPDVLKTFRELIALGVDGLWISFDDTGAGQAAPEIIRAVLDLGKGHGMTGRRIAVTPPLEAYQAIDEKFNRQMAKIEGFAEAQWFFTRVPCPADAAMARQVGLARLPGWWHNLVNFGGGFLHNGEIICTLRADGRPAYVNLQPISKGWHTPDYEPLRNARQWTDTVMLWGVVSGWPEEYEVAALGLWAWHPETHDWEALRDSIYRYVYGPAQVRTVHRFDDELERLKSLFEVPAWRFEPNKGWPCRLKRPADRGEALRSIGELEGLAARLRASAPRETAIDPARLETIYLEPMGATLVYARKMALLDYPEQWAGDFENEMYPRVDEGDWTGAERCLAAVRDKIRVQLQRIESELQGLKGIDLYVRYWQERTAGLESWKRLAQQRRQAMAARLKRVLAYSPARLLPYKAHATAEDLAALVSAVSRPPVAARPLLELKADDWLARPARVQGSFAVGPFRSGDRQLVAIAFPADSPSQPGDHGQVEVEIEAPRFAGRLLLDAFVNDTRIDNRYPRYRFLQLLADGKLLWEEDIAPDRAGREWVTADLTPVVKPGRPLKLCFRVVDKRGVGAHASIALLGPVRLRQVP